MRNIIKMKTVGGNVVQVVESAICRELLFTKHKLLDGP